MGANGNCPLSNQSDLSEESDCAISLTKKDFVSGGSCTSDLVEARETNKHRVSNNNVIGCP